MEMKPHFISATMEIKRTILDHKAGSNHVLAVAFTAFVAFIFSSLDPLEDASRVPTEKQESAGRLQLRQGEIQGRRASVRSQRRHKIVRQIARRHHRTSCARELLAAACRAT
jgi:hypothetical protein